MTVELGPDLVGHIIGRTGELTMRVAAGHIELRGTDGDAVRLRDLDGQPLEDQFQIDREPNRLNVRLRDTTLFGGLLRGGPRRSSVRLSVEVPRGASIFVDAASAEIVGSDLTGDQRYRSASGNIRLTKVSGTISVESVSGDVVLEPDGELRLAGRSVSGNVDVHGGRLPSMTLASTSGDLEVDASFDGPGPFAIQTVSGDATVHARGGIRVEARTVTGVVASNLPYKSGSGRGKHDIVVGDGRVLLAFKSISGDLRIADPKPASDGVSFQAAPGSPAPVHPPEPPAPPVPDAHETERLAILRELERGAIDVAEAGDRLAALDGGSND